MNTDLAILARTCAARASRSISGVARATAVAAGLASALLLPPLAQAATPTVETQQTRTSRFQYDPSTGLLVKEIVEPGNSDLCVVNEYLHDAWGNRKQATTRNCNGSPGEAAAPVGLAAFDTRISKTEYDARGQFPQTVTNALNQQETHQYDARFGQLKQLTGPNQLTTRWDYDGFGRKKSEARADGTSTSWQYNECLSGGCAWRYEIVVTATGAPQAKQQFDRLGRETTAWVQSFTGTWWRQDQSYDERGRVISKTRRYEDGSSGLGVTTYFYYDLLNRVWGVLEPRPFAGQSRPYVETKYEGLKVSVTDSRGYTTATQSNVVGQKERVTDPAGGVVRYGYDALGNLVGTDAGGIFTVIEYDLRGRKTAMNDPDTGRWTYRYDALGQLRSQTDAKSQTAEMLYDKLGRLVQRNEPDLISYWAFDQNRAECGNANGKAVGKPARAWTSTDYSRIHCYDDKGRPVQERTTIGADTFVTQTGYDSASRPETVTYPTTFQVRNVYNATGYLRQAVQVATGTVLWQANTLDPDGHITAEQFGNGVETYRSYDQLGRLRSINAGAGFGVQSDSFDYDLVGNITYRTWQIAGVTRIETFGYDARNRLQTVTGNNGPPNKTYDYDALGNFKSKSDLGTYSYVPGTHRLASIQGSVNGVTNPSYVHDSNGNLKTGAGFTIEWTSFNMPARIDKTGATGSQFNYGPEHQRIRQIAGTLTTLYVGSYERDTQGGVTIHKHYIAAAGRLIAQYTTRSDGQPAQMRYMHSDHLGSVVAVTNEAGAVVVRYRYDAWGKRRNLDGTDANITTAEFDRGFTAHEMLDALGLVHMNGRVYDPTLGRFVSADPFVQAPGNLQSYNRYAYVVNNPLTLYDPSGYNWISKTWKKVWHNQVARLAMAAFAAWFVGPLAYEQAFWWAIGAGAQGGTVTLIAGIAGGAAGGGAAGLVGSGGDIKAAAQGALTGGVFGGIGAYFPGGGPGSYAAHAAAGCASAALQGGDCARGAASQLVSKFVTVQTKGWDADVGHFAVAVVAGGTVSAITGGKFENGAYTAAFGYLFNYLSQEARARLIGAGAFLGGTAGAVAAGGCTAGTGGVCALGAPTLVAGGIVAGAVTGEAIANAWDQLDNLLNKATNSGPLAVQYALVAERAGLYPTVGGNLVQMNAGDVWKYGISTDPAGRYPAQHLSVLGLRMDIQTTGTLPQVYVAEKIQLINYAVSNGALPPGNRIFK